jgi:hypothetical protein
MRSSSATPLAIGPILLGLLGCAAERDPSELLEPDAVGIPVVDALLVVGRPLPPILLTRTLSPRDVYSSDAAGIVGAEVYISYRDQRVAFVEGTPNGAYLPTQTSAHRVQPEQIYTLDVRTQEGERVYAWTLTPPRIGSVEWVLLSGDGTEVLDRLASFDEAPGQDSYQVNRVIYANGILESRFARPDVLGFVVGLFSLDRDSDFVIDPDFFDEEDFEDLERIGSSPPLTGADGTLRLPWFAIYYEGRYVVKLFAMDRNWYDLARSTPELSGGAPGFGGPAGDSFERPIFHVEGGIGLFGSASVDSVGFYVLPKPAP